MKNKKVIFLIPSLNIGGGERAVSELSLNLPVRIETTIVLFKNEVFYPYKGKLNFLNLPISRNFFSRAYSFFLGIYRFRKIIKKERPDWVISLGTPANLINVLSNQKAILRIDNFLSAACQGLEGQVYRILIKLLFNKAIKIVSVSQKAADDLIENFGIKKEKVEVIYNPIEIEKIKNLAKEQLKPEHQEIFKSPVIINIGRITKEKNLTHLIKTFKRVKIKIKEAKLVILGQGESESELRELARELKIESDVYFLGWQKNPFKFLVRARLFVLTSLWECLPYGVLEAMACGLPVVSVDCKSGPREILAPNSDINQEAKDIEYADYGILCPVKNENKLTEAIIETLTNRQLSDNIIKKSYQRIKNFDAKKIIKKWDFLES